MTGSRGDDSALAVSRDGLGPDIQVNCAIVTWMFRALRCTVTALRVQNGIHGDFKDGGKQRDSWTEPVNTGRRSEWSIADES